MPFTPFHFGPALLFGLLFFKRLHFPTFLIANVVVDLEPLLILLFGLGLPFHGFFHSFLGAAILALVLGTVMLTSDKVTRKITAPLELVQRASAKSVFLASFAGVGMHILLDSVLYADIKPFFPLSANPFYWGSPLAFSAIYGFCIFSFFLGIALFALRTAKGGGMPREKPRQKSF